MSYDMTFLQWAPVSDAYRNLRELRGHLHCAANEIGSDGPSDDTPDKSVAMLVINGAVLKIDEILQRLESGTSYTVTCPALGKLPDGIQIKDIQALKPEEE